MSSERDTEVVSWVALRTALELRDDVANALAERLGGVSGVLNASRRELREAELGSEWGERVRRADFEAARWEVERARRLGVRILVRSNPGFPSLLREVDDCPSVLYVRGRLVPDAVAVAVVGARRSSPHGLAMAERIARELATLDAVVVSGLALGVDGAAHRGALGARNGSTVAVLGSGLDRIYPPAHRRLAEKISRVGALVSEFPLGTPPFPRNFPRRNRVISGLCKAVVVVEANTRSGSLITASRALQQGRDVFAVPGEAGAARTRGTHQLIRDGARLVESGRDVLEEIDPGLLARKRESGDRRTLPPDLPADERRLLESFDEAVVSVDRLIERSGLDAGRIHAGLVALELRGLVKAVGGMFYSRAEE